MKPAPPLINRLTGARHSGHSVSGASVIGCRCSNLNPHDSHSYSYVGMFHILPALTRFVLFSITLRKRPRYSGNASTIRFPLE